MSEVLKDILGLRVYIPEEELASLPEAEQAHVLELQEKTKEALFKFSTTYVSDRKKALHDVYDWRNKLDRDVQTHPELGPVYDRLVRPINSVVNKFVTKDPEMHTNSGLQSYLKGLR